MVAKELIFAILAKDIRKMHFSVRVINDCKALGIKKVFEIIEKMKENNSRFLHIFGLKSIAEIKEKLSERGIGENDLNELVIDEEFKRQLSNYEVIYNERKFALVN